MTKKDLLDKLSKYNDDMEIMIYDRDYPRKINSGPCMYEVNSTDANECTDCEGLVGSKTILIGYGSY